MPLYTVAVIGKDELGMDDFIVSQPKTYLAKNHEAAKLAALQDLEDFGDYNPNALEVLVRPF